jgi:hypothetical protein
MYMPDNTTTTIPPLPTSVYPWATAAQLKAVEGYIVSLETAMVTLLTQILSAIQAAPSPQNLADLASITGELNTLDVPSASSQIKESTAMSQLDAQIAALKTSTANAVTRVTTDLTNLQAQIVALQAAGTATPQDLTDLATIQTTLDGLDAAVTNLKKINR